LLGLRDLDHEHAVKALGRIVRAHGHDAELVKLAAG
jgi:hypothetical protein